MNEELIRSKFMDLLPGWMMDRDKKSVMYWVDDKQADSLIHTVYTAAVKAGYDVGYSNATARDTATRDFDILEWFSSYCGDVIENGTYQELILDLASILAAKAGRKPAQSMDELIAWMDSVRERYGG